MASHILLVTQLLQNSLGKNLHAVSRCKMTTALAHLAQFDTHLVVRVDSPDRALHMDLVLVHCDQSSECSRRKLLEHYTVRRLVALKDLGLDKGSVGGCCAELLTDLLFGLAECESSGRESAQGYCTSDRWVANIAS